MLGLLRAPRWRRRAAWARAVGLALLLVAFFVPMPAAWILAVTIPGLALLLGGAVVWLVRTPEPWLRGRA